MDLQPNVQPVAIIQGLDQEPFRSDPKTFSMYIAVNAGGVGNFQFAGINCAKNVILVVDGAEMDAAGTATNVQWGIVPGNGGTGLMTFTLAVPQLNAQVVGGRPVAQFPCITSLAGQGGANASFQITLGSELISTTSSALYRGPPVVLFNGDQFAGTTRIANTPGNFSVWGREYQIVPSSP